MKKANLLALALLAAPLACTEATPAPVTPEPPPAETAAVAATPPPAETAKPAEPTPEEKKKAEDARKLAEDRAQWEAEHKVEAARWTPELHAAAKKLGEAKHASLKASVLSALKGPHRKPKNAERDAHRHPLETLEFLGLRPNMTVLDVGPGDGWFTELLAPTLAVKGKLLVTSNDPDGPADQRSTYYGQRLKGFLDLSPELYGKIERIITRPPVAQLGIEGKLDMVLMFREMHGMHRDKLLTGFLGEVFKALKPGGVLGVEQHRAKADANPDESAKKGYLPEAFVIQQVEAAGFKLEKKSEINANPRDTKDYEEGVWALPPTFRMKDKDRAKYAEIGESDRMTLKFVKPKKK
jgi:predicted methyltransferase